MLYISHSLLRLKLCQHNRHNPGSFTLYFLGPHAVRSLNSEIVPHVWHYDAVLNQQKI